MLHTWHQVHFAMSSCQAKQLLQDAISAAMLEHVGMPGWTNNQREVWNLPKKYRVWLHKKMAGWWLTVKLCYVFLRGDGSILKKLDDKCPYLPHMFFWCVRSNVYQFSMGDNDARSYDDLKNDWCRFGMYVCSKSSQLQPWSFWRCGLYEKYFQWKTNVKTQIPQIEWAGWRSWKISALQWSTWASCWETQEMQASGLWNIKTIDLGHPTKFDTSQGQGRKGKGKGQRLESQRSVQVWKQKSSFRSEANTKPTELVSLNKLLGSV